MMRKLLFLVLLALPLLPGEQVSRANEYAYVFNANAKFLKIEVKSGEVVDIGNLWWMGLFGIRKVTADPFGKRLVGFASSSSPEKFGGPQPALVVLEPDDKGDFQLIQTIKLRARPTPDARGGELIDFTGLKFNQDGSQVFVSWNEKEGAMAEIIDGTTYRGLQQIREKWTSARICFSPDGAKVYAPFGSDVVVSRVSDYRTIERIPVVQSVGSGQYFSKSIAGITQAVTGCVVSIVGYRSPPNSETPAGTVYLYNLETKKLDSQLDLRWFGNLVLLRDGYTLLVDVAKVVPNILPDGSSVGTRTQKVGALRVFDLRSHEAVGVIDVPVDGKGLWISPDGARCFYASPRQLSIIDLQGRRILRTVTTPFVGDEEVVFLQK